MLLKNYLKLRINSPMHCSVYNPLINYDWSTTTAKEYKTDGVELVVNGGFDTDLSGWTIRGNTVWDNGKAHHVSTIAWATALSQGCVEVGSTYLVKYSVIILSGAVSTGLHYDNNSRVSVSGTYSFIGLSTSTDIIIRPETDSTEFYIDNISVQKVIQEPNKRYLKDVGSTPTYNASMYFGRGAYFNGVDQHIPINTISLAGDYTISFTSNTDGLNQRILFGTNVGIANFIRFEATSITYRVNSIEYSFPFLGSANTIASYVFKRVGTLTTLYINGVSIVSKTIPISTIIFDKVGTSAGIQSFKGTLKDVYMFNRTLTQSEITQSYEQPELFYAMAQADSTCVLNMPMCENDGYVRNMKTYSLGSELVVNGTFASDLSGWQFDTVGGQAVYSAGRCHLVNNGSGFAGIKQVVDYIDQLCLFSFDYEKISGDIRFQVGPNIQVLSMETKHYDILVIPSTTLLYFGGSLAGEGYIDNITVKKVTGAYPISNYTSSVRDNAKNLRYGLQTCKFVRDSLGVIQSASQFLEGDGVGYCDTKWKLNVTTKTTLEFIFHYKKDNIRQQWGSESFSVQKRFALNKHTDNALYIYLGNTYNSISSTVLGIEGLKYISIAFDYITASHKLYINGIFVSNIMSDVTMIENTFKIGRDLSTTHTGLLSNIRLFKVHNKALTQEEITKNYNDAVAQGLLS